MRGEDRIFINYRRAETRWAASRLYDDLGQHFGRDTLFMDVDSIPPGADFVEYLNSFVDQSKAIIVLIGPNWLGLRDDLGRRRIDDPDDFVNIEIRRALRKDLTVIPVLVDGAKMPSEADLPDDLRLLSRRQAVKLGHDTYGQDLERLTRALGTPHASSRRQKRATPRTRGRSVPWWKAGAGLTLAATAAIVAVVLMRVPAPQPQHSFQVSHEYAVSGRWSSDYGDMVWTIDGASYGAGEGRIVGSFDGLNFKGHWVESKSEQPCAKARDGSSAWGTITLTFDAGLEFFQGQWGYCDTMPDKPWAGTRARSAENTLTRLK